MGSLLPPLNEQPQFLQMYFMGDDDASTETDDRCQIILGMERVTVPGRRVCSHVALCRSAKALHVECVTKRMERRVQGALVDGWPGVKALDAPGRIYSVHITHFECYCVRLLLTRIRGPTSFQALKIVVGQEKATFQEACEAMELLEDDGHWDATNEYAMLCRSATTLRKLFAIMRSTCGPSNPRQLWDKYKNTLSEDIARRYQGITLADDDIIFNEALKLCKDKVVALAAASSGIAATWLSGGRTGHYGPTYSSSQ
ncbi:unnamed protein product [Chilo suppressalis]|uniref:Uncharacterized protein n=1 Tax=Chilo suppressalis TaxID=168631 RepID=A0ABN8ATT5_CHISP|nr:unnamed protein product [Chilo suppressalis]